jgi:phosphatidylserine synthase
MPTPAGALLVVAPMIILSQALTESSELVAVWSLVAFLIILAAAILMNLYPIRYLHMGRFMSRHPWFGRAALALIVSVFTPYYGYVFLLFMLLYALSPLVTWRIGPEVAGRETRAKSAQAR